MAGINLAALAEGDFDLGSLEMALPVSNEKNKQLEGEVKRREREIAALQVQIDEHRDRAQALRDHLRNVRQELGHTQALYGARKRDLETEDHMRLIAEREGGRIGDEMKRANSERAELKEKMNVYENTIFRTRQRTEELKAKMNWDQQALEAWLEESARQDEDAMTLAKYSRADEGKIKELTLKMEQLQEETVRRRRNLDTETTETLTAQIELDKTAEAFRQMHKEREQVISQWEQTIAQMKKRDQDMDKCAIELARLKAEIKSKENLLKEKQEFLSSELDNNGEKSKKLEGQERSVEKQRLEHRDSEAARVQFKDELETLKYAVDRVASDLESTRAQSNQLSRDIKDKRSKLETLTRQRELMQDEIHKSTQKSLSAEERAAQVDRLLATEEEHCGQLTKELEKIRERQFKGAQELHELRGKEANMSTEHQGGRAAFRNLGSSQNKLDEEALKQQEILYTQDFQLQQLQQKLNRLEGERSDEEKTALHARIKELEGEWAWQQGEEAMLRSQLKRLQDNLRRTERHAEKGQREKAILEEKIDEINLHIDSTQRELKKVVAAKQDLMVDENITKLEVKRLRDTLFSHAGEVQSLEKQRLELDTALSERSRDIAIHKDMLRAQIKSAESERQTISAEMHERISKIDRLRKRYEIITVAMQPPEGEEEHSQAYYVIKAAQEREELQREGDELDAKIRKAEKEIRAMENTLHLMNGRNETYRKSLTRVDKSSEEVGQLEMLEGQWRAALDKLKHKKKLVHQLEEDLQTMGRTMTSLTSEYSGLASQLEEKKSQTAALYKELEELEAKKERAAKQTSRLVKDVRLKARTTGPSEIEQDIELRELRDFGMTVVQHLGGVASREPQLASTLQLLFTQAGLPPPSSPASSRTSSAPSSARSSSSQLSGTSSGRSTASQRSGMSTPTPRTPLKTTDIGALALSGSSTPRAGMSPHSSTSSLASQRGAPKLGSLPSSRRSSRPPSLSSSSSRASSKAGSRKDLDLSIGPS